MAYTRGSARKHEFHQDDGIMLDKDGKPILGMPVAAPVEQRAPSLAGHVVLHGPGEQQIPKPPVITGYRADKVSFCRHMEPHDLAMLLDMYFAQHGEAFEITATPEEFSRMNGNLRQHFMPVRGK